MLTPRHALAPAAFLACTLGVAGCNRGKPAAAPPPPAKVTVAKPGSQVVASYREYTGYVEAVETVNVRARVRGYISKVAFQDREGEEVKAGDLLYEIDPPEFEAMVAKAEADAARARAESEKAVADVARVRRLQATNAVSAEELAQREADQKTAAAAVKQTEALLRTAKLELSYTRITAPIAGRISKTQVTAGNLVGANNDGTTLTTIVSLDPVYVTFDVPERNYVEYATRTKDQKLPPVSARKLPIDVGVSGEDGFPHPGVIDFRENRVESGTGTIRVRGKLANADRVLLPGLYARIRVPVGDPAPRLTVPEVALQSDQRGRFVYVVKPDNAVEYRPVVVGTKLGAVVAIESGLTADDRVVVNGVQAAARARAGGTVDPQEQGSEVRGQKSEDRDPKTEKKGPPG